jgi:G3E family GTPase
MSEPLPMVPVHLLVGTRLRAGASDALPLALAHVAEGAQAVIVEGGPGTFVADGGITLVQLAAGCVCCVGQLPLRVTVARLLRQVRPARLWIEISDGAHLAEVRRQLSGPGFHGAIALMDQ